MNQLGGRIEDVRELRQGIAPASLRSVSTGDELRSQSEGGSDRSYAPADEASGRTKVIPHGTNGGYNYHGCRCEDCKRARAAYMRNRRCKKSCSVDGCEKPHVAKGYCKPHWRSVKLYGDPFTARQNNTLPVRCRVNECGDRAIARGLCVACYARWQRNGTTRRKRAKPRLVRHLPSEPLHEIIHAKAEQLSFAVDVEWNQQTDGLNALRRHLRMSGSAFNRLLRCEKVRWDVADRVCDALGVHPAQLWHEWTEVAA